MSTLITCLFLLTFVTITVSTDFSLKGDPCSKFDSCHSKSVWKTCSCDTDCYMYGTCCHDMIKPEKEVSGFRCYEGKTASPVFVKRSCADDFRGHAADRLACFDDDVDEMDIRNNLLMISFKTKITYWNKHCAKCNNEVASDLEFWDIEVFCPPHNEVNGSLIRTNLTFDQDRRQWGLVIGDEFLNCVLRYTPPYYVNEVKHCTPNMISSCPANYSNVHISAKCSQYYAERKVKNSDLHFRNIHCAICNGADVKELECPGMSSPEDNVEESDFRDMVEEIFTNGDWLEREPSKHFECSRGFTYDPAREKCRRHETEVEETAVQNSAHDYRPAPVILMVVLVILLL